MAMKKTVAIIGSGEGLDPAIMKHLSTSNYRLLVFDHKNEAGQTLLNVIKTENPSADVDCAGCLYDASWEADVIILNEFDKNEITNKIKPVATQKPVIDLSGKVSLQQLKELLPDSKIIKINQANPLEEIINILETF